MQYLPTASDLEQIITALESPTINELVPSVTEAYRGRVTPFMVSGLIEYIRGMVKAARVEALKLTVADWAMIGTADQSFSDLDGFDELLDSIEAANAPLLKSEPNTVNPSPEWDQSVAPLFVNTSEGPPLYAQVRSVSNAIGVGIDALADAKEKFFADMSESAKGAVGVPAGVIAAIGGLYLLLLFRK